MHDYNIRNCQKHSLWSHLDKLDITNNVNTTSNVPCTKNGSSVSLNIVIWNRHNTVASFSYKELISSGSYTLTIHMLDASIPKVLFHCVNHSEFLVMNHNIPRRTLTKKVKVMWFFFCGNLNTSEKCAVPLATASLASSTAIWTSMIKSSCKSKEYTILQSYTVIIFTRNKVAKPALTSLDRWIFVNRNRAEDWFWFTFTVTHTSDGSYRLVKGTL